MIEFVEVLPNLQDDGLDPNGTPVPAFIALHDSDDDDGEMPRAEDRGHTN